MGHQSPQTDRAKKPLPLPTSSSQRTRVRRPQLAHVEAKILAWLAHDACTEAELAVLELDALSVGPRRHLSTRRELISWADHMVVHRAATMAAVGLPSDAIVIERERYLRTAFYDRVRELRAAAAPGGHA